MKTKLVTVIMLIVIISAVCIALVGCSSSSGSSGGTGIIGYIIGVGLIIGGIIALFVDGKNHGIIYVIGEIAMVILLITFG